MRKAGTEAETKTRTGPRQVTLEIQKQARHPNPLPRQLRVDIERVQTIIAAAHIQHAHRCLSQSARKTEAEEKVDLAECICRELQTDRCSADKVPIPAALAVP